MTSVLRNCRRAVQIMLQRRKRPTIRFSFSRTNLRNNRLSMVIRRRRNHKSSNRDRPRHPGDNSQSQRACLGDDSGHNRRQTRRRHHRRPRRVTERVVSDINMQVTSAAPINNYTVQTTTNKNAQRSRRRGPNDSDNNDRNPTSDTHPSKRKTYT